MRFCPVCMRVVESTRFGAIQLHLDRADRMCPAGGEPFYITIKGGA